MVRVGLVEAPELKVYHPRTTHPTNREDYENVGMQPEFIGFPSIARLSRDMVVTEKIDGTNAQIHISEDGVVLAGSRNRWLRQGESDNFGFRQWVEEHEDALRGLGPGSHFGEWWGSGIQRRYGLAEKRFSLFNTGRWTSPFNVGSEHPEYPSTVCTQQPLCHVVPVLKIRTFDTEVIEACLMSLSIWGSAAAPGFMDPEGIVVYHTKSKTLFKKTLDKNDEHKGV